MLTNSVSGYIDILMISETKLDDTFSHAWYHLKDFSNPCRLGKNSHGREILVYVRDNIPSNLVKLDQKFENFQDFFGCLVIRVIHRKITQNNTYLISDN